VTQDDLFKWTPPATYPEAPGFKEETTSKEAARKIKPRAEIVRSRAFAAIAAAAEGLTPDQAADIIDESVLTVRPRVTELSKQGLIYRTGVRRKNASGMTAAVWKAKESTV
jgi:hypothetical protein